LTTQLEQKNKDIQNLQGKLNREKEQADNLNEKISNALQETEN